MGVTRGNTRHREVRHATDMSGRGRMAAAMNKLFFGDNLEVLRHDIPDECQPSVKTAG
jgi:hypothetical protein